MFGYNKSKLVCNDALWFWWCKLAKLLTLINIYPISNVQELRYNTQYTDITHCIIPAWGLTIFQHLPLLNILDIQLCCFKNFNSLSSTYVKWPKPDQGCSCTLIHHINKVWTVLCMLIQNEFKHFSLLLTFRSKLVFVLVVNQHITDQSKPQQLRYSKKTFSQNIFSDIKYIPLTATKNNIILVHNGSLTYVISPSFYWFLRYFLYKFLHFHPPLT